MGEGRTAAACLTVVRAIAHCRLECCAVVWASDLA